MVLHFLGTGAADWDISKADASIDFRRNSSLLIDGTLLVDPGPCVFEFAETFGCPALAEGIRYIVNTHNHADHFCPETVERLKSGGAEFIALSDFESANFGGYTVTALPANHATAENPHALIIEGGGKSVFYGCDGAWLPYVTYRHISKRGFDMMIFDATIGDIEGDYRIFEHNNLRMVEEMKKTLAPLSKRFMISHMARTLHTCHDRLVSRMAPSGIEVAHDNLKIEL